MMRKPFSRAFPQASAGDLPVQVAAVCYRIREFSLEFLLVNTTAGKWTFPKGRIDRDLSASESAAREALEEAGVKGRIAEEHFGTYIDTKRAFGHENRIREICIVAYLLEVGSLVRPQEGDRNPTWFSPQETQKRLAERRAPKYAHGLARIVDAAVDRVQASSISLDGLARSQRVIVQR
jgi:8-oxo-dGTP pyrophosphatase MutT (NUDIX family)